ncbi:TPA: hypothetical protein U1V99_001881 [Streptococcus suis]|nr:hypothetical protein [Streptococcus suis]HEM4073718.1 hypothetical protein [Streptococcus suis]
MTELTTVETNVLNIILPYRFDKPIKFEKVQERTKLSRRTLKKKGHPVGSHKTAPFGLYMAKTREELEIGMRANVKQAETTLEIARVQRGINLDEYWREAVIAH